MQKDVAFHGITKPISYLSQVSRQGRNYSTLVVWLLYTVFKGRTKMLAAAVALSLSHFGTQGAAIYVIYWYARQMERTGVVTVPILHYVVNLRSSPEWLWVIVVVSAFCFILSAGLMFLSRQIVLSIAEKQYASSLEELVLVARKLPDPRAKLASQLLVEHGVGGLSTGCRRGALIAGTFVNAISAVVGGAGATIFLIRIDPSLTLLILVAAGFSALFLYPLTMRAVRTAKGREKAQVAFAQEKREIAARPLSEEPVLRVKAAHDLARAFLRRRRVVTELVFAIEIGITIILSVVVFYMANQAFNGREEWASFIAYIGALRITLQGCAQAIQAFASVSRYYPMIVRHYALIKDVQKMDRVALATVAPGDDVRLGTLANGEEIKTVIGARIAMKTCDSLPNVRFALIDARLPHSTAPLGMTIVDSAGARPGAGALALVCVDRLSHAAEKMAALSGALDDKVTVIAYGYPDKIGQYGEDHLLTIADGELLRYVALGTDECTSALEEIALLTAKKRQKHFVDEEDDDDEDGDA